jgi:two-component system alkaline phosphatase synthesis response regulator PhoP
MAKTILVVDDDLDIVKMLASRLKANGYHVLTAFRGKAGLEKCKELKPDAVILDIMMPDMSGTSVAEELKNDPNTSKIPIIFLTAAVKSGEIPISKKIGNQYFLAKPFKSEELLKIVARALFNS